MIHHVFANRSNIGDWLSAKGIQRLLQAAPVTEHLCDEVFVAQTLDALNRLEPSDLVLIGGGGIFMDYFAPFWVGLSRLDCLPRYCIWGVGYCDLKAEPSHPPLDLVRRIVAGSELCVVRDELTRVLGGQRPRGTCRLPEPGRSQCTAPWWMGGSSRRQLLDGRCRGLQGNGCGMPTLHFGHGATVSTY